MIFLKVQHSVQDLENMPQLQTFKQHQKSRLLQMKPSMELARECSQATLTCMEKEGGWNTRQ